MREKYIEQKLVREVKKRGGLCEKWNSGSSGWPDRLVLLPDGLVLHGAWNYISRL